MFLTSKKIKAAIDSGEIGITGFSEANMKGASYAFTLDSRAKLLKKKDHLDSREDPIFEEMEISADGYDLKPNSFVILHTKEKVSLKGKYICLLSTRATMAQMGLDVLQGSFLCEPDTENQFALEVTNRGTETVRLYPGIKIVKGIFAKLA